MYSFVVYLWNTEAELQASVWCCLVGCAVDGCFLKENIFFDIDCVEFV